MNLIQVSKTVYFAAQCLAAIPFIMLQAETQKDTPLPVAQTPSHAC